MQPAKHLNQAGAQVLLHKDGSVLINHSGVEMGQGLHTKVAAVCASLLGLPLSAVHIAETSTNCVPNTAPTAASSGSDLNGNAVRNACEKLFDRLKPYIEKQGGKLVEESAVVEYQYALERTAHGRSEADRTNGDIESAKKETTKQRRSLYEHTREAGFRRIDWGEADPVEAMAKCCTAAW